MRTRSFKIRIPFVKVKGNRFGKKYPLQIVIKLEDAEHDEVWEEINKIRAEKEAV